MYFGLLHVPMISFNNQPPSLSLSLSPHQCFHLCRYDLLNACNGADDQDEDVNPLLHVEMEMVIVQVPCVPEASIFTCVEKALSPYGGRQPKVSSLFLCRWTWTPVVN